jgi:hypothetical protein
VYQYADKIHLTKMHSLVYYILLFNAQILNMWNKTRILIFCTNLSEIFIILRIFQRDIAINVHRASCKLGVIPIRF